VIVETVACVDDGVESIAADAALLAACTWRGEGMDSLMLDMCDGAYLLVSGAQHYGQADFSESTKPHEEEQAMQQ